MAAEVDYDPTDLEAAASRREERGRLEREAQRIELQDLAWLLSGTRGRRIVRRQLKEAGIRLDDISSSYSGHYGQMAFSEGLRTRGFRLLSGIMRLLASGDLAQADFRKLMEADSE